MLGDLGAKARKRPEQLRKDRVKPDKGREQTPAGGGTSKKDRRTKP